MKKIKLTLGKSALVDNEDFDYLNKSKWHASKIGNTFYAFRNHKVSMHRTILNDPIGMQIDHIDHNGLNNQKSNLRICTPSENACNKVGSGKTKYKGVSKVSAIQKRILKKGDIVFYKNRIAYKSFIKKDGKQTYLGTFKTPELARDAYELAALKLHGNYKLKIQ
jgi:hypothetical protein